MCATSSDNALPMPERDTPATDSALASTEELTRLCSVITPEHGIDALIGAINDLMPDLSFRTVLCRGGWHRLGGVVDSGYKRVTGNIAHWVEQECAGDVDELIASYSDAHYFATRLSGKTHFITAARSDTAQDFVQIEIEQLQECLDRPLVDRDWFPDSVEEFLEPIDYPLLEPEPIRNAYYQFRRITSIADLLDSAGSSRRIDNLCRFFADWSASSAGDMASFCDHWVLALREYRDHDGVLQLTAKPVATYNEELPELPQGEELGGIQLANAIHAYDRQLGYPFAWYFTMLGQRAGNYALAQAVLADQIGAYEYLPARDLAVLRRWESQTYAV